MKIFDGKYKRFDCVNGIYINRNNVINLRFLRYVKYVNFLKKYEYFQYLCIF